MEWISVEDRLPTEGQNVLVYGSFEKSVFLNAFIQEWKQARFTCVYVYEKFSVIDALDTSVAVLEVTHWMPLPEKPK